MMINIIIVTFAVFKIPYIVVKLYEFYTSRKVKELMRKFTFGEMTADEFHENSDIINFVKVDEINRITECVGLIDLAIRPFVYYKLSYYFSNSFDKVINCNKRDRSDSSIRVVARRRRNDTENTTCTTITIDTVRTPLNDDVSEGGSSDNGSIIGSQIEGSITEYRLVGSALNDEYFDGSFCENLYDMDTCTQKRKFGGSFCDNDVRVHETDFLCDDARRVSSALVLSTQRQEGSESSQSSSSTSQPLCHSSERAVFEI